MSLAMVVNICFTAVVAGVCTSEALDRTLWSKQWIESMMQCVGKQMGEPAEASRSACTEYCRASGRAYTVMAIVAWALLLYFALPS